MQKQYTDTNIPIHNLDDFQFGGSTVQWSYHQAPHDDLTSAGLLLEGLSNPIPPIFQDPDNPSPSELRKRAVYENYRALADTSKEGGFGTFYGPREPISGLEVQGVLSDSATSIVQIPEAFNPGEPKLLLIPASSSRGVYGGILLSEWGLSRGYATVLCDKGCGTGFHNLSNNLSVRLNGQLGEVTEGVHDFIFQAPDSDEQIDAFRARHPHRYATKHAHSTHNVESRWGLYVLESLDFAHEVLQRLWPEDYDGESTRVLATGLSNGGGAALRAAESDTAGRIDAVVVGEPNVTPVFDPRFKIQQGNSEPLAVHSQSLLEYASTQNLFQSVASLALQDEGMPFPLETSKRRLQGIKNKGLWRDLEPEKAAQKALEKIYREGILPEQNFLAISHAAYGVYEGMAVALANCHGRYQVTDHLFGFSYAAVDEEMKTPCALPHQQQARLYALSNGLVPTAGVQVVNDLSVGGSVQSVHSISPGTSLADANLDGAVKLYTAAHGKDPITGEEPEQWLKEVHQRVARGIKECRATAELKNRPAIIVNGRCDSIISPNQASRSYLGCNLVREGRNSRLSYIELEHAQHLDALNSLPGFKERYVPLLPYVFQALSLAEQALESQAQLPPSQVVRTTSRGPQGEPLTYKHIPPIKQEPEREDLILLKDDILYIPE